MHFGRLLWKTFVKDSLEIHVSSFKNCVKHEKIKQNSKKLQKITLDLQNQFDAFWESFSLWNMENKKINNYP